MIRGPRKGCVKESGVEEINFVLITKQIRAVSDFRIIGSDAAAVTDYKAWSVGTVFDGD